MTIPGKIAQDVVGELGQLAKDTVAEITGQAGEIVLGGAGPTKKQKGGKGFDLAQLRKKDQLETQKKIGELRKTMPKGRDVEEEIKQVREKKNQQQEEEEKLATMIQQKRQQKKQEEEKAAQRDTQEILPPGKKPTGLPPWVQKGTRETDQRRAM